MTTENNTQEPDQKPASPTQEEIHAAAEKARKDEHTKSQRLIEKKEREAEELKNKLEALQEQHEAAQAKLSELEVVQKAIDQQKGTVDVEKLVREVAQKTSKEAEDKRQKEIAALSADLDAVRATLRSQELEMFKREQIAAHGGDNAMVVAMVSGNSKEEILNAIEVAKATYSGIVSKVKGTGTGSMNGSTNPPIITPPIPNASAVGEKKSGKNVREMSPEELQAYKADVVRQQLAARGTSS